MKGIQKDSFIFSLIITAVLWLILCISSFFIKLSVPVEYKTIKIRLEDTPVVKEVVSKTVSEPVKELEKKEQKSETISTSVEQKTVDSNKEQSSSSKSVKKNENINKTPSKTETVSKSSSKNETVKTQTFAPPKKSVQELAAESANKKTEPKEVDWAALFGDDDSDSNVQETAVAKTSSSFSGSAAVSDKNSNSSSFSSAKDDKSVSDKTMEALKNIKNTTYTNSSGNTSSSISVQSSSSNGKVNLKMDDGRVRELLWPLKPDISISDKNARLIDAKRTVKIRFIVSASGSVPYNSIEIIPAALLPLEIQGEIKEQISKWTFSQDNSGMESIGVIECTLDIK